MAKTHTRSRSSGLTRGKAVLIGVLTIVLAMVLYIQYGRYAGGGEVADLNAGVSERRGARPPRPAAATLVEQAEDAEQAAQTALLEFDQAKWSPREVSQVIAYDPFALPSGFPQPAASGQAADGDGSTAAERSKQLADALAELRMQLDELKERGVHVILGKNGQYVAMIGDRTVHVGDQINEFTVTEIDPKDGIQVDWTGSE